MQPRLDQVIFWAENGRVAVLVEYFDTLGKLRSETFHRPTQDFAKALGDVALTLAERGLQGPGRVRRRQGSALFVVPSLQKVFLEALITNEGLK
ncbi:MAG: hypothetical protein C4331_10885 [Meiothermus sp.]